MYLITRPHESAEILRQELAAKQIAALALPLLAVEPLLIQREQLLARVNAGDGVLLISPTAINFTKLQEEELQPTLRVMTVGGGSAALQQASLQREVYYPANGSGIKAVIEAGLLVDCWQIAIVGSEYLNPLLEEYLQSQQISYDPIACYRQINQGLMEPVWLAKLVCQPMVTGIIITSRLAAQFLFSCAEGNPALKDKLKQLTWISTHPQISTYLQANGFTIIKETTDSSNQAIINLIEELEDERQFCSHQI